MACMKLILQRSKHIILLAFAFFLLPTFIAQAKQFHKHHEATMSKNQEKGVKIRTVIGSRPPKCEERCNSRRHCEAVQVPIAPTRKFLPKRSHFHGTARTAYWRGDDISNYKPMHWKCKCGDSIFNPW